MASLTRIAGVACPAAEPAVLHRDDFVLLTDDIKCWIVRIEDIYLLEACRNFTRVHFPDGKLLIRRTLGDCERRLDSSIFFRASRGCIVNLSQVKQPRLSKSGGLSFVLRDGKEVAFSRRQNVLFRTTRGL
jgi:two-component system, LytTR family, response regulator